MVDFVSVHVRSDVENIDTRSHNYLAIMIIILDEEKKNSAFNIVSNVAVDSYLWSGRLGSVCFSSDARCPKRPLVFRA